MAAQKKNIETELNNVIHFPQKIKTPTPTLHNIKKSEANPDITITDESLGSVSVNKKNVLIKGSVIVSILFVTGFGNFWFQEKVSQKNRFSSMGSKRDLASVSDSQINWQERNNQWENKVSHSLASWDKNELMSASLRVGQKPNAEDELRFSQLNGMYSVIVDQGLLKEINHTKGSLTMKRGEELDQELVTLGDVDQFLMKNKSMLPRGFHHLKLLPSQSTTLNQLSYYTLLDPKDLSLGQVEVINDDKGRLISLKIIK
ncbi:MAG: hypothetical protein K1X29_08255 [Bdellovibrionales bacterium]|nr:hypothetical protein [Bdellovibrionales bacterium]